MSIDQVRKFSEKGCGPIIMIGLGLILVAGLYQGFVGGRGGGAAERVELPAAVTVGATKLTAPEIENAIAEETRRESFSQGRPQILTTMQQATIAARTLHDLVVQALTLELGRQKGIPTEGDALLQAYLAEIRRRIDQEIQDLVFSGKVKADASPEEKEKAFAAEAGQSSAEILRRQEEQFRQGMQDETIRRRQEAFAVSTVLMGRLEQEAKLDYGALKKKQDQLVFKILMVSDMAKPNQDVSQKVTEIQNALRGGLSFEQAMERYSTLGIPPGRKSKADQEVIYFRAVLEANPALRPLASLEKGQVSEPIELNGLVALYKLERIQEIPDEQFRQNVNQIRFQTLQTLTNEFITSETKRLREAGVLKWANRAYEALYEYWNLAIDAELLGDARKAAERFLGIANLAAQSMGGGVSDRSAALVRYAAFEQYFSRLSPEERKAKANDRLEMFAAVTRIIDGPDLRLDMARMLREVGNAEAGAQLQSAAERLRDPGMLGQRIYREIDDLLPELEQAKLITPAQVEKTREELRRWAREKQQFDKFLEEQRKAQEEATRQAQEAAKGQGATPVPRDRQAAPSEKAAPSQKR